MPDEVRYIISLCVFICRMGTIAVPTSLDCTEYTHVRASTSIRHIVSAVYVRAGKWI